jgi:long-chain acyl-CoA synthetase
MGGREEKNNSRGGIARDSVFWRVEGSLLNLTAVRPVAFFTWNAQSFAGRWIRRTGVAVSAVIRPLLYATNRVFATRMLHILLRGVSQDRLDLLGEEYFEYVLKPRLKPQGLKKLRELQEGGHHVILVSQGLDHVMRPLARYLGVEYLVANRLEFRQGLATGRLLDPVIRPRGGFAWLTRQSADGRVSLGQLAADLGFPDTPEVITQAIIPAVRPQARNLKPLVLFGARPLDHGLSVRQALAGKRILLIGVTGFIGKVWFVKLLTDLPEIGKIYLLIRPQRGISALHRFEKIVAESPAFDPLHERYKEQLARFLSERVEVLEGDICQPSLGLDAATRRRLAEELDLVVNCSGLTDFNPDLRVALAVNVEATLELIEFLRQCDHAALLHLSTCYVVGCRDGRVPEQLRANYTPASVPQGDAESLYRSLWSLVREIEAKAASHEVTEELEKQARRMAAESGTGEDGASLAVRVRRYRPRWLRNQMVEAGMKRARELGWPNTYTMTKSLAESLILSRGADLPVAVVRPSIVETSLNEPFTGWNEGVNTSAPISYLLGTYFRQLPSNKQKRLDIIPVDLVSRGLLLIAAALVERRHHPVYQLATSARNPCNMRRSIELTSLAHRKFYRAQNGWRARLRAMFESIPVSKERYERLSAPGQKAVVQTLQRWSGGVPFIRPPLVRRQRYLERVEKLIELYEPFILLNDHIFEADHIELLARALVPEEEEKFGYDVSQIDWWDYWINVHIPALRRWSYPVIEGRPVETRSGRRFQLAIADSLSR